MAKFRKALLVHREVPDIATRSALKEIERMLRAKKISCKKKPASILLKEDLPAGALIIIVGTDGTFLRTCRFVSNQPVVCIGLESHPGACALSSFGILELAKLESIIEGNYSEGVRERLLVSINGFPLEEPVLNEVFFGSEKAYKLAEYEINFGDKTESQKSSGVLIATGTGSTSWFASAKGKPFDCELNEARFLVREAHKGSGGQMPAILFGRILSSPETKFNLTAKKEEMILVLDSANPRYLTKGDKVTISFSKAPLHILRPKA
ncbi:NAD kinase [uncultured archaeon]|nr:NAD kinase [uncultured archaeon]